jgi:hypothetical protein
MYLCMFLHSLDGYVRRYRSFRLAGLRFGDSFGKIRRPFVGEKKEIGGLAQSRVECHLYDVGFFAVTSLVHALKYI